MRRTSSLLVIAALCLLAARSGADEVVDYLDDVKPILARHCVSCHGAERPRGGLRLDYGRGGAGRGRLGPGGRAGAARGERAAAGRARRGGDRADAAEPAAAARRGDRDPPPLDRRGGPGPGHGRRGGRRRRASTGRSARPSAPEPPEVEDAAWPRNPIDRFILAALERDGIAPSPEADRATLIRRAEPRPDRPAAVARGGRRLRRRRPPDAYERLVDRLLASPALRRALGPDLARRGPLRRLERLQHRRPAVDLAVPRLGHRRPEPRPAVRRVHRSTSSPATSGPTPRSPRRSPPASTGTRRSTRKGASTSSSSGSSRSSTASTRPAPSGSA